MISLLKSPTIDHSCRQSLSARARSLSRSITYRHWLWGVRKGCLVSDKETCHADAPHPQRLKGGQKGGVLVETPLSPNVIVSAGLMLVTKGILLEHALVLGRSRHTRNSMKGLGLDAHAACRISLQALADKLCSDIPVISSALCSRPPTQDPQAATCHPSAAVMHVTAVSEHTARGVIH